MEGLYTAVAAAEATLSWDAGVAGLEDVVLKIYNAY